MGAKPHPPLPAPQPVAVLARRPQIARSMRLRLALRVATLLPALTGGAKLAAQEASPYLPMTHWATPYLEHLIAAGVIDDPSPLTRPLRRSDVLRALETADTLRLSRATLATVRRLKAALATGQRGPYVSVDGGAGAALANYARREPLAAIDSIGPRRSGSGHGTVNADLDLALVTSHVVAVTHLQLDTRLKYDPDWFGKKNRAIAGRTARSFELWYLNPLNSGVLEQWNNGGNVNSFVGLDFERRGKVTLFGQLMLDDIQVDRAGASDQKPVSYALTVGTHGAVGGAATVWRAWYTRVTNLTYRNEDDLQVPLYHFLGTGRNFDDYDQVTVTLGLLPRAGLLLTPELT